MSFLPGSLTPALLRSYRRKVISPFRRSFNFEIGICFIGIAPCQIFCENKKADYAEHHKSAGAWLSLQSDVLCNRLCNSKSGSASYSSCQQNQRRGGAVRHFSEHRIRVGQTRHFSIWSNSLFSCLCSGEPLCHYYTSNVLCRQGCEPSHYIRNFKRQISTVAEKFSLPVRTFSREISTGKK